MHLVASNKTWFCSTGWKYEPNKLCSCSKAKKLGKCADLVWACHSGLKYEHRLRSPCLTDRPLFVTSPGKGDNHLAPVLKRANWIMHHGGESFARWSDIRRYFYIHPDNRDLHVSYMIGQRASYLISIVTGSKSIMWPPRLMSRHSVCVWHQCIRHQWQPLPRPAF